MEGLPDGSAIFPAATIATVVKMHCTARATGSAWPVAWLADWPATTAKKPFYHSADSVDIPTDSPQGDHTDTANSAAQYQQIVPAPATDPAATALYPQCRRVMDFTAAELVRVTEQHFLLQLTQPWNERWRQGELFSGRYFWRQHQLYTLVLHERRGGSADEAFTCT